MPNRIIREGHLDSERVDQLSEQAENFYSRLRLIVDDYGRFEYSPRVLLSKTYPLRRNYTVEQLESWMAECMRGKDPLVITYRANGKPYIQVQNFCQRIRKEKDGSLIPSKFPAPPSKDGDSPKLAANGGEPPRVAARATNTPSPTPPDANTPPTEDCDPEVLARETAGKLHKQHPVLCSAGMAEAVAIREMAKYVGQDARAIVAGWECAHAVHIALWEEQRRRDPKTYIPQLHIWFRDEMYLQKHVGPARAAPESMAAPAGVEYLRQKLRETG